MTNSQQSIIYEGGCHCGAVRFQVVVKKLEAIDCNCSICTKKGFLHLIVPLTEFRLLKGADVLSSYTFNTRTAKHTFCSICGIHSFYYPRSHPNHIDVNIRCLDNYDLSRLTIKSFDGANWEQNIKQIQRNGARSPYSQ